MAAITPEWVIAAFVVAVILLDLFVQEKRLLAVVSLFGLAIAGVYAVVFYNVMEGFNQMLVVDGYALFFKLLFLGIAFLVILASNDYVKKLGDAVGEYYVLILLSTLGMMLMASTNELISIYLALELTSIPMYILVGLLKDDKSTESSLKYLLLGAVASAVLLYGMAMVYGFTGHTQLSEIANVLRAMTPDGIMANPALLLGIVMLIAGFGFKIAAVPFQLWVPDVYEGAPTTITAFLSVGSKAAGFAVIMRVFYSAFGMPSLGGEWGMIFAVLAVLSMIVGNVAAIPQINIKRMLGYSSIAQAGYLMVGLATMGFAGVANVNGQSGVMFFLASYALTNLGAFIAIIAITNALNSDNISDFAGMGKRAPVLALALTLCLISLVGMPPAAGFMAKFYIFRGAVQADLLWLVIIAVINSVISAYYYLRVVKVMWFNPAASEEKVPSSVALKVSLAIACLGVLAFGIVPSILIQAAQRAADLIVF
ncbi:MAG: NADH-quinone oxidoreductase subunit N [Dehalococcoidales bacterium]|nr:NADH-quinone oxidoreductase subunit N [Dehalococcoidales bacterium]